MPVSNRFQVHKNPRPVTPLLDLRRPIPGAHGSMIGKQLLLWLPQNARSWRKA